MTWPPAGARRVVRDARIHILRARPRPGTYPRLKGRSLNRMLPNLLTMLGLCAGLTSIRLALEGRFGAAAVAITVAGAIDGLDGRLARLLKATSRFGAEFDSLSDFLCFGVAPALVLYLWSLQGARGVGFIPCLMFAVCMALRLARFNAALDSASLPVAHANSFFTGVPAPAGAGLALFPLFVGLEAHAGPAWVLALAQSKTACAIVLMSVSLLLVSTLPVWNFKSFKVPDAYVLPLLLGTGLFAALLVAEPWSALATAGVAYVGMLPLSARDYRRLRLTASADDRSSRQ